MTFLTRIIGVVLLAIFLMVVQESAALGFVRREATQEEIDTYIALVIAFMEETREWKPEEYAIRYSCTLADAPLAIFQTRRYDVIGEMPPDVLGRHPTGEVEVYVQTEEMRAFADYEESLRIWREAQDQKAGQP